MSYASQRVPAKPGRNNIASNSLRASANRFPSDEWRLVEPKRAIPADWVRKMDTAHMKRVHVGGGATVGKKPTHKIRVGFWALFKAGDFQVLFLRQFAHFPQRPRFELADTLLGHAEAAADLLQR